MRFRSNDSAPPPACRRGADVRALAVATAFGVATLASGCATTDAPPDAHAEKEYRTGSNIPVRDRNAPSDAKTYDPNSVQDAVRGSMPRPPLGVKPGG